MKTIVIVGGGAGGLELATRLGDSGQARVVLVDRWPAHFWKPLLHTVASGKVDAQAAEIGYAAQAREHGFEFARGEVLGVDREARAVLLAPLLADDGAELLPARSIAYDQLVLALGSVTNLFGVPGAAQHALTLEDVPQAEAFRQRFMDGCLRASVHGKGMDIVIVGGGATGVELAAELNHSARMLARYNFHARGPEGHVRIRLVERGSRLLPHLDPRQSKRALRHLRALGVKVATDSAVARVDAHAVIDTDGTVFPAAITLWAAGVQAPAMCATLGLPVSRLGQVVVGPTLQALGDPDIYAIGDCASFTSPGGGAVPPRAQAAHQQALYLAGVLASGWPGKAPAFAYHDYGSLVSLGPLAAVGMLSGLRVGGVVARLLYALMYRKHLMALQGFARMAARTVADWINAKLAPPVRLH